MTLDLNDIITYLMIGVGLSFDSFAVSVTFGIVRNEIRFIQGVVVASSLAFFQALFPLLGWFVGKTLQTWLGSIDHWIAFILLAFIGFRMIMEGLRKRPIAKHFNPLHWKIILGLSVATSIDALAVGLSFGFLKMNMLIPVLIIGAITFLAAMLGMLFGKFIPGEKSHRTIIIGGIILIAIGIKILLEHL